MWGWRGKSTAVEASRKGPPSLLWEMVILQEVQAGCWVSLLTAEHSPYKGLDGSQGESSGTSLTCGETKCHRSPPLWGFLPALGGSLGWTMEVDREGKVNTNRLNPHRDFGWICICVNKSWYHKSLNSGNENKTLEQFKRDLNVLAPHLFLPHPSMVLNGRIPLLSLKKPNGLKHRRC